MERGLPEILVNGENEKKHKSIATAECGQGDSVDHKLANGKIPSDQGQIHGNQNTHPSNQGNLHDDQAQDVHSDQNGSHDDSGHHSDQNGSHDDSGHHSDDEDTDSTTSSDSGLLLGDAEVVVYDPPDGGFGWVICISAFFVQLICDGLLFSFGVLYISLLEHFQEGKSTTSWVGAVFMGFSMLMGPLAGALANKIGCRLTAIMGSVIACLSFIIGMFSPNIAVLAITYGALAGTGVSMMYLCSIVMVGSYFKKRRALANGIAMCGSGIGTFIMSPLLRFLLDEYDWNGTLLILAGIALNGCVFCSFFRPVTYKKAKNETCDTIREDNSVKNSDSDSEKNEEDEKLVSEDLPKTDSGYASNMEKDTKREIPRSQKVRRTSSLTDLHKFQKVENRRVLALKSQTISSDPHLHNVKNLHSTSSKSLSVNSRIMKNLITTQSLVETYWGKENVSTLSRREIFMSGSAWTIPRVQAESDRCSRMTSHPELPSVRVPLRERLRTSFDLCLVSFGAPLLRDPVLLLIVISCIFWTGQSTIYTYLVDYALHEGIDKHSSAFLLSIIGITNTISRIVIGWITDHPKIDSSLVYMTSLLVSGVVAFVIPFCKSFLALAICSGIFGICMASYVSLRSIIVVDLLGIAQLTSAFGLVISFQGIFYTVVPPIAGAILEVTGTYMGPFLSAGAFYTLSAILIAPVRLVQNRCHRKKKDVEGSFLDDAGFADA